MIFWRFLLQFKHYDGFYWGWDLELELRVELWWVDGRGRGTETETGIGREIVWVWKFEGEVREIDGEGKGVPEDGNICLYAGTLLPIACEGEVIICEFALN